MTMHSKQKQKISGVASYAVTFGLGHADVDVLNLQVLDDLSCRIFRLCDFMCTDCLEVIIVS